MEKIRKPTKAEITENRRRLALDYAIRAPAGNGNDVVENAAKFEAYLAGKAKKAKR